MANKSKKISPPMTPQTSAIENYLADLTTGLIYISETDAAVEPFIGEVATVVTADEILRQTEKSKGVVIETGDADEFFARLTSIKDWFGDREKESAAGFLRLKIGLMSKLSQLTVFRIGKIRVDIYVVGRDDEGRLVGIQTSAVET